MKITEIVGIYHHMELASPEAYKAQRQAELANLAAYRHKRLQKIIDWSDPEKRAEIRAQLADEDGKSRAEIKNKTYAENVANYKNIAVRTDKSPLIMVPLTKIPMFPVKRTRWQRLKLWIAKRFK